MNIMSNIISVMNGVTNNKKNKFTKICKMSQRNLKKYVAAELANTHGKVDVGDGYVYAQGDFPVLLVAHLDTVHDRLPKSFVYSDKGNIIASPTGIGGDDRCGVYMILEVIKKYNCSVLFCEDEEIGAIGAEKFTKTDLANTLDFNYIIEFDRKGSNDAVFYDCDNPDFEDFICMEFFKMNYGSFSDISTLAPFFGCAAVNLSCGYYKAHTLNEYVVFSEMEKVIEEACKILARTHEDDYFAYIPCKRKNYGMGWNYGSGDFYSDYDYGYGVACGEDDFVYTKYYTLITYMLDDEDREMYYETDAYSKEEAIGRFLMLNPDLTYNHILEVMSDEDYM